MGNILLVKTNLQAYLGNQSFELINMGNLDTIQKALDCPDV